jgi:hypothetical protein
MSAATIDRQARAWCGTSRDDVRAFAEMDFPFTRASRAQTGMRECLPDVTDYSSMAVDSSVR